MTLAIQIRPVSNIFICTFLGIILNLFLIIYVVSFAPIFLYRWILIRFISPRFSPAVGKAVTVLGQFMATEFLRFGKSSATKSTLKPPRCAVVCSLTFSGTLSAAEIAESITEGWLTVENGESELRYPEFKQYIEMWMGFMFWKPDLNFSLDNHFHVHSIPEQSRTEDCENFLCNFVESLVNKPFLPKRSPWEVHLLQNYKTHSSSDGDNGDKKKDSMTVIVFRFHHAMADGFSIMYAIVEGLMGRQLPSIEYATPKKIEKKEAIGCAAGVRLRKCVYSFWRIFYDAGYALRLELGYLSGHSRTPWHVSDEQKKWKQLYKRSELIPVEKIKFIKNQLASSFTGVVLSSLAAGVADNFQKKGFKSCKGFPIATVLPLEDHPNKLRNHWVATVLELNVVHNLNPMERLKETEKDFQEARHFSQMPFNMWLWAQLFSSPVAPIARFFSRNRFLASALTNFPGPGIELELRRKNCVTLDACVGGLEGLVGVVFTVVSYHDHVRIAVTAEKGVMKRKELEELIRCIEKELDLLYECAQNVMKCKDKCNASKQIGDEFV